MVVKDTVDVKEGGKKDKKVSEPKGERRLWWGFYRRTDLGEKNHCFSMRKEDRGGGPCKGHKPKQYSHQ